MFATRYFANNFFAPRYFPKTGVSDVFYFAIAPNWKIEFSTSWSMDEAVSFGVAQDKTIILE